VLNVPTEFPISKDGCLEFVTKTIQTFQTE